MKTIKYFIILLLLFISFCSCTNLKYQTQSGNPTTEEELISKELSRPPRQFVNYEFNSDSAFIARVKEPPDFVMNYIREMDKKDYTFYEPAEEELKIIKKAFKHLPPFYKSVMKERVLGIYFINSFLGSGMTDWVVDNEKKIYCTLFFNPITLKMNMSEWLTYKEKTCFIRDTEDVDIEIKAGTIFNAFLGILLHESTHVVDYVKNITPFVENGTRALSIVKREEIKHAAFVKNIWRDIYLPETAFNFPQREDISFYGLGDGPNIKISSALEFYELFSNTPFASIYGSMSWSEDLAEFFMFYHLTRKLKQPYVITLLKNKKVVFSYEPMENKNVRKRFYLMESFYR